MKRKFLSIFLLLFVCLGSFVVLAGLPTVSAYDTSFDIYLPDEFPGTYVDIVDLTSFHTDTIYAEDGLTSFYFNVGDYVIINAHSTNDDYVFSYYISPAGVYDWYSMEGNIYEGSFTLYVYYEDQTEYSTYFDLTIQDPTGGSLYWRYWDDTFGSPQPAGVYSVLYGSDIVVTATADAGYVFSAVEFTNPDSEVESLYVPFIFTVTNDTTVNATFALQGAGFVTPTPTPVWNERDNPIIDWDSSFEIVEFPPIVQLLLVFLVGVGLPLCVAVFVPRVGLVGFVGTFCFSLTLCVIFFGMPFWVLIFVALGVGYMLFSMMYRG